MAAESAPAATSAEPANAARTPAGSLRRPYIRHLLPLLAWTAIWVCWFRDALTHAIEY